VIIHQRRVFIIAMIAVGAIFTGMCAIAVFNAWRIGEILNAVVYAGFVAVAAFSTYSWLKQLRKPKPLAVLTPTGIVDDRGETFTWDRITKIQKFTGVLFFKDDSKAGWAVRLDPAEVGPPQVRAAIVFVKQHAPSHLTERL
jgi:hypothetical protein